MAHKLSFIKRGYQGGMDFQSDQTYGSSRLLYCFFLVVIIFFVVLSLRLFQLTVVKGEYYRRVAEGNRIREVIVEPLRGMLTDRKGAVLAKNLPADVHASGLRLSSKRVYSEPLAISQMVGYRQIADEKDTANDPCVAKITIGDKVGKKGAEKLFECDLRGVPGKKLIEVDASGNYVRTLTVIPPTDGRTVQMAMNVDLQKKASELLKDKKGAIVVLKPQTGEVLALFSSPTFNNQDFEDGVSEKVNSYLRSAEKPLFNRATEGTYPPGSIFKLAVATGVLEEKKVDENTQIEDTGVIRAGAAEFGNWYYREYGKTEGSVNMVKAIQRSNDIYFYRMGEKLGDVGIKTWAEKYGYGRQTGIGLEEAEGTIPSGFWKEEVLHEQWYLGDTYNYAIGQGYTLVTPLQVARATAAIANNGLLCKPKLLKVGANSETVDSKQNESECVKLQIRKKTLDIIHQGMEAACTPGGTGWPLFNFVVPVACKTGTAESSYAGSQTPHAWFTAYAPAVNPEIVVTALVEEGGQGSDIAGPLVKAIFELYFHK